jgi:hypothetical protein
VPSIILTAVQVMYTQVGPQGIQGETGPAGATGVVAATSPIVYNSGTQTVSLSLTSLVIDGGTA